MFSYFSQNTGYDISCKLSPICIKCQILFSRKNKKKYIINLSSAKLTQNELWVNIIYLWVWLAYYKPHNIGPGNGIIVKKFLAEVIPIATHTICFGTKIAKKIPWLLPLTGPMITITEMQPAFFFVGLWERGGGGGDGGWDSLLAFQKLWDPWHVWFETHSELLPLSPITTMSDRTEWSKHSRQWVNNLLASQKQKMKWSTFD